MSKETAIKYIKAGLNPVPLAGTPTRKNFGSPINDDVHNYEFKEIGICTGAVSGGLEGLDFDLKYAEDLSDPDKLWRDWKSRIPTGLLKKLTLCSTKNKGYHLLYRTDVIEGNRKLASRFTREEERSSPDDKKRVLIETRGEGGYLKCYPSEGYEVLYGDLLNINKISDQERAILISTSILFDQTLKDKKKYYSDSDYKDPFPVYNSDPDIGLDLLLKHGWEEDRRKPNWVEMTRPGKSSGISAGYNLEGNFLYVLSTSTIFEDLKPYSNSAIFCMLEADGDFRKGYAMLGEKGYGTVPDSEPDDDIEDLSFVLKRGEGEEKLFQTIDGTIPIGLSYGWPELDEYLAWKDNTLNFSLAFENVGKTYITLHKLAALSVLYGKKFALSCGENDGWEIKQYLLEALSGKPISHFKGNHLELQPYREFLDSHFFIMKNKTVYSVEEVLERTSKLRDMYGISGVFIDPFSYYKKSQTNQYAYVDSLLSELNLFSKTVCSVIMSLHTTTDASRAPRDQEGYLKAPGRYDAVFGNMWANRSDSFLVYHRITRHKIPNMRRLMEVRVEKVKNISTGGSVTPVGESVYLTYKEVDGFLGYFDSSNNNPIYNLQQKKKEKVMPKGDPSKVF